jgi:rfaE bifunctional protein nucleotidyltransferase chain/domain
MFNPAFEDKVCTEKTATRLASLPRPMVFTNGCFDLLHRGHATYLAQARTLGASLVVGVNSDESVRRLNKGSNRPINLLADRMAMLAALESVSAVIAFDEETPLKVILALKPDVLVKGADYALEEIVGGKEVASWGGKVMTIPVIHSASTTRIIEKIRAG